MTYGFDINFNHKMIHDTVTDTIQYNISLYHIHGRQMVVHPPPPLTYILGSKCIPKVDTTGKFRLGGGGGIFMQDPL